MVEVDFWARKKPLVGLGFERLAFGWILKKGKRDLSHKNKSWRRGAGGRGGVVSFGLKKGYPRKRDSHWLKPGTGSRSLKHCYHLRTVTLYEDCFEHFPEWRGLP